MKYYFIAGEASGDMHGANLVKELKKLDHQAVMRGWGGDKMHMEGVDIVKHYRELAFMGFIEVVKNLRTIFKNLDACKKDILHFKPDVVILIDYPGFNLRIAKYLKKNNIRVFYYISPQIWAWKESRVFSIKKTVNKMFVILPFEKEFYKKFNMDVEFTGHPLLDEIEKLNKAGNKLPFYTTKKIIALMPGSRMQEIKDMLPLMLNAVRQFPTYEIAIAAAPNIPIAFYQQIIGEMPVQLVEGNTYTLLQNAYAALVTSGTATLETALFNVPEIVCYKGNRISYLIAKQLIKVKYISLVNLILDSMLVKELIQDELNQDTLIHELTLLLEDNSYRNKLMLGYHELKNKLGNAGASAKAARSMFDELSKTI
jgi:lipid-A-disaccharide synthase